jgi:hypothetical protein
LAAAPLAKNIKTTTIKIAKVISTFFISVYSRCVGMDYLSTQPDEQHINCTPPTLSGIPQSHLHQLVN